VRPRWGRRRGGAALVAALLAALALALTLARLSGGGSTPVAILQAAAPLAVPAYAAALAVLGGLLLRPARTRPGRRPLAVVAAVTLALLGLHLSWLAPRFTDDAPRPAAGAPSLRVMTVNLEYGQGSTADVVRHARDLGVDLLVVQEATPAAQAGLERAGIDDLLPHRSGQAAPGPRGTLVYSTAPLTAVEPLPTGLRSYALTTAGLRVLGVHPAYPLSGRWAEEQQVVVDAVRAERPDLVVGDLNATLDHPSLRRLADLGLRDAAELSGAGLQPTWPTTGYLGLPVPPSFAIDHVLVGEGLTVRSTRTLPVPGSDHRALVAEVARVDVAP